MFYRSVNALVLRMHDQLSLSQVTKGKLSHAEESKSIEMYMHATLDDILVCIGVKSVMCSTNWSNRISTKPLYENVDYCSNLRH